MVSNCNWSPCVCLFLDEIKRTEMLLFTAILFAFRKSCTKPVQVAVKTAVSIFFMKKEQPTQLIYMQKQPLSCKHDDSVFVYKSPVNSNNNKIVYFWQKTG